MWVERADTEKHHQTDDLDRNGNRATLVAYKELAPKNAWSASILCSLRLLVTPLYDAETSCQNVLRLRTLRRNSLRLSRSEKGMLPIGQQISIASYLKKETHVPYKLIINPRGVK